MTGSNCSQSEASGQQTEKLLDNLNASLEISTSVICPRKSTLFPGLNFSVKNIWLSLCWRLTLFTYNQGPEDRMVPSEPGTVELAAHPRRPGTSFLYTQILPSFFRSSSLEKVRKHVLKQRAPTFGIYKILLGYLEIMSAKMG